LEIPELVGLGKVNDEDSEKYGTAMLEAFASALEVRLPYTLSKPSAPILPYRSSIY